MFLKLGRNSDLSCILLNTDLGVAERNTDLIAVESGKSSRTLGENLSL